MTQRVVLPTQLVPFHYSLQITPDFEGLTFATDEVINVTVREATDKLTLHAREITIHSVAFASLGEEKEIKIIELSYNYKANTVSMVFDKMLPLGEGQVKIKYTGILNGDMAGFYKSTYADANGNKKIMGSTQFEALDARRAFPCWDEPGLKATFSLTLIVPAHLTALSNMPEQSVTHIAAKSGNAMLKKVVFQKTPLMSTYLLAWAIGEFDCVSSTTQRGVAIRVFSPPGRAEEGRFALDVGKRALDFFDDFFKVAYPLPKMDMICITEFAMGAMENWGLVTYRETALMIDEAKASPQSKQRVAVVVAHELAHQWFGNLVTMQWWDGLWLNEGFAAFMENYCTDKLFPDYHLWDQFTTDAFGSAQRLDALQSSHPVIVPIKHAEEVEQVFDAISYCKGSTVVKMIFSILGEEKFKSGLQYYMSKHSYGNTETVDLWDAWSQASGLDIAKLMHRWTKRTGYPLLRVVAEEWTATEVLFTLEQSRFLSDGSAAPEEALEEGESPFWTVPLFFATAGQQSSTVVLMDQQRQTFSIPIDSSLDPESQFVQINAGQKALARVEHSASMLQRLQGAIQRGHLSAVDRAALVLDNYALAKAGLAPVENVVSVLLACAKANETSSIVWAAISAALNGLYVLIEQLYAGTETFTNFVQFGRDLVVGALHVVGWDAQPNESHTTKLLRASVMGLLDTFAAGSASVASEAKRRFDAHWSEPGALPAEYKTNVYKIVLSNGSETEYERVLKSYYDTEDNQERKYAMFSLGSSPTEAQRLRTLRWAVESGDVKLQDIFYPVGSVACSLAGAELAWKYYKENFALIKEKLSKASPSIMDAVIVNSVSRFCTNEKADEIEAFFVENPLPSSARRISQTIENMRASAKMLESIAKSPLAQPSFWVSK